MASGVCADYRCVEAFNRLKMKRETSFVIYGFDEAFGRIVVKHEEPVTGNIRKMSLETDANKHWYKFLSMLPEDGVCYAAIYVHYRIDTRPQTDIVFVLWAPDTASLKHKILVSSSISAIKPCLVGIRITLQANDKDELDLNAVVVDKLKGNL